MNFGNAFEAMRKGDCVRRSGWNGKGMHIYAEEHFSFVVPAGAFTGEKRKYDPVVIMFTAQRTHQPGWLPSQQDLFANDWEVLSAEEVNGNPPAKEEQGGQN